MNPNPVRVHLVPKGIGLYSTDNLGFCILGREMAKQRGQASINVNLSFWSRLPAPT